MRLKITPEALSVNHFDVRIAIGVAGNRKDGVTVRNYYRDANGNWTEIQGNSYPLTQLLTLTNLIKYFLIKTNNRPANTDQKQNFMKLPRDK